MTTEHTPDSVDTPPEEPDGGDETDLVRTLRQQNKDLRKALDAHEPVLMEKAMRDSRIDPESAQGKMLAEVAKARKTPLTTDGIQALAAEFGVTPAPEGEGGGSGAGPIPGTDTSADANRQAGTNAADEAMEAGNPVPAVENREAMLQKIDEAQAAGDVLTVIRLQRQLTDVPK